MAKLKVIRNMIDKNTGVVRYEMCIRDRYNHLIAKKDELKNAVDNYIKEYGNDSFEEELEFWNVRIETVEY